MPNKFGLGQNESPHSQIRWKKLRDVKKLAKWKIEMKAKQMKSPKQRTY